MHRSRVRSAMPVDMASRDMARLGRERCREAETAVHEKRGGSEQTHICRKA